MAASVGSDDQGIPLAPRTTGPKRAADAWGSIIKAIPSNRPDSAYDHLQINEVQVSGPTQEQNPRIEVLAILYLGMRSRKKLHVKTFLKSVWAEQFEQIADDLVKFMKTEKPPFGLTPTRAECKEWLAQREQARKDAKRS